MTSEQIENFLHKKSKSFDSPCRIFFKARHTFEGMFISTIDYTDLKKKNFWRIVAASRIDEYLKSKDMNLSRIFNGSEFTKLATNE